MSKLQYILEDMLTEAKAKGKANRKLQSGLHIEIVTAQASTKIVLWREQVYPSMAEWDTVMKHFPYDTPRITPTTETTGNRFAIHGTVPSARTMQLKFG